jgi:hypothetical protein
VLATLLHLSWNGEIGAGDALVGAGTLGLAWFTWRLARQTQADVATSQRAIEAADMPYVIAVPVASRLVSEGAGKGHMGFVTPAQGPVVVEMQLENIGKGPAVVVDVRLQIGPFGDVTAIPDQPQPLGAGRIADIRLQAFQNHEELRHPDHPGFSAGMMRIYYTHASGTLYQTASAVDLEGTYLRCLSFIRGQADGDQRVQSGPTF